MSDKSRIEYIIKKYGDPRISDGLIDLIKPSIRLKLVKKYCDQGQTKFGGIPDLPRSINWPINSDIKPYSFICQIRLSEIKNYDEKAELPNRGMIYVFFNLDSMDDGKIIYYESTDDLTIPLVPEELKEKRRSWIQKLLRLQGKKFVLDEFGVEIFREYHLPSWNSLKLERLLKSIDGDIKQTAIFRKEVHEESLFLDGDEIELTTNHHLLGNYNGIQHGYHELELLEGRTRQKNLSIKKIDEALKWKLLFQLDSDNNLGLNWGDWGKIYFFIEEQDLIERKFDKVKIIGECH